MKAFFANDFISSIHSPELALYLQTFFKSNPNRAIIVKFGPGILTVFANH